MNIGPNHATPPAEIARRDRAATRWLERNDPQAKKDRKAAKRKTRAAAEQAKRNPALVARYRRAMLKI
ncbi:MAG TPA: hypothetical protein VNH39_01135 [Steroidobacteraceae bacterium]|nr:hypothetical protein [Steroidobacteraceae bacterium]